MYEKKRAARGPAEINVDKPASTLTRLGRH